MKILRHLVRETSGVAAVEMALSLPILLVLICGSVELGNYFMDEHRLVKAVRDGARYAARQDLTYFTGCSGDPGGTVKTDTQTVVKTGLLSGGNDMMPGLSSATIDVTVNCTTTAGGTSLSGFYANVKNSGGTVVGAPIVTVTASVPYTPVVKTFGFNGWGLTLNASQQAAVIGW
jgi:Flp pilus assembly protein TadG